MPQEALRPIMPAMAHEAEFKAGVGDRIHLHSRKRRGTAREGEIVEVRGTPGAEYYLVQWPNGRQSLIHPGIGVTIPEVDTRARAAADANGAKKPAAPARKPVPKASAGPAAFELHKPTESTLRAEPGDRLAIKSRKLSGYERDGEILEVLGQDGQPPYLVRWSDTGREAITRPGSDAYVDHLHSKGKQ